MSRCNDVTSVVCRSKSTESRNIHYSVFQCDIIIYGGVKQQLYGQGRINAALHWARKPISTSFPVGNIVPLVRNVVFPSGKLGILRAPGLPARKYEFLSPMECSIRHKPTG